MLLLIWANALLAAASLCVFITVPYQAFAFSPVQRNVHRTYLATSSGRTSPPTVLESLVCNESDEELIHDIEVMEGEAKNRLKNLMEQMDELQAFQDDTTSSPITTTHGTRTEPSDKETASRRKNVHVSAGVLAPEKTEEQKKQAASSPHSNAKEGQTSTNLTATATTTKTTGSPSPLSVPRTQQQQRKVEIIRSRPLDLLADTSWKIVLNIGREEGTWMPSQWGQSGSRLRIEVHCTFSSEVAPSKDLFFTHSTQPVRYITIEEAFAWPTMVGVGRRSLQIDPKAGRYQICPGAGPAGTDLLRLMIPIPEDLRKDDVTLNAGRVYGTTGYFGYPDEGRQQIVTTVQEEYDHCLAECTKLQLELAKSENFVSWFRAKNAVWNAKRELDHAMERLTLAGQHYPDHAHMRTDPTGRVGLAKEGGLCIQVHTGLAMEYHILGRMEVGHLKR